MVRSVRRGPQLACVASAVIALTIFAGVGRANVIYNSGALLTSSCNSVCPDLTTSVATADFTLVGVSSIQSITFVTFQAPSSYQGGIEAWALGVFGSSSPLTGGTLQMSQDSATPVTISGIPLTEYSDTFSVGTLNLSAGSYYLSITDHQSPPDQFGIFWATTSSGLAFSLQGSGNLPASGPEPGTIGLTLAGLVVLLTIGNRRSMTSRFFASRD